MRGEKYKHNRKYIEELAKQIKQEHILWTSTQCRLEVWR